VFDDTKPDGTPRKLLDISRLQKIDWVPSVSLKQGVGLAYDDFLKSKNIEYAPKGDRHEA
jgi:GDP-L-fucose synthase